MTKVIGLGGAFVRSKDPEALYTWYAKHLGIARSVDGAFMFDGTQSPGMTVIAFFPLATDYFGPGSQGAMLNFRVDDLDGVLENLVASGVEVDPKREDFDFGRFGWFKDPEGNRVELWEPKDALPVD